MMTISFLRKDVFQKIPLHVSKVPLLTLLTAAAVSMQCVVAASSLRPTNSPESRGVLAFNLDTPFAEWESPNFSEAVERSEQETYFTVDHTARPLVYVSSCEQLQLREVQQSAVLHFGYGLSSDPSKADMIYKIFPNPCRKYDGEVQMWNTRYHYAFPQWFKSFEEAKSPLKSAPGIDLERLMATRKNPEVKLPKREEGHKMLRTLHSKLELCENAQEIASKFHKWAASQGTKKFPVSSRSLVIGKGWVTPPCVSLPAQLDVGRAALDNAELAAAWPLWAHKTEGSYLGAGVLSISPLKSILQDYADKKAFFRPAAMVRQGENKHERLKRSLASAYTMKPFLYKDPSGAVQQSVKTDFRTYALITGTFPPRVYMSKQGIFRAADPASSWDKHASHEAMMESFQTNKQQHVTNAVKPNRYLVSSLNGAFDSFANSGPLLPQYAEAMEREGIDSQQSLHDARMASTYTYVNQFNKADCVVQHQLCNRHFVSGFADVGLTDTGETYIYEMAMHTVYKNRPGDAHGKDAFLGAILLHIFWSTRGVAGAVHIGGGKLYRECHAALVQEKPQTRWSDSWLAEVPSTLQRAKFARGESRRDILATMCAEKILAANFDLHDTISGAPPTHTGNAAIPLWKHDQFLGSLLRSDHLEMLQAFEDLLGTFARSHPLALKVGGKTFA